MIIGAYYRCPIEMEDGDKEYPRLFALGQLMEFNELADAGRVVFHDLLGSGLYYADILSKDVFAADKMHRCEAMPGGTVRGKWGIGTVVSRVQSRDNQLPYEYYIKLSSGKIITASETELQIEYSQMNYSPEKQLTSYEFQHPSWFFNHLKVSQNRHLIDNAVYGFEILAGCRAFLLPHQVSTVARCFESRPIRYMLADEVGLGKTVEACSILKILSSEKEGFKSLVIAPGSLVSQWQNELHYKFDITATIAPRFGITTIIPLEALHNYPSIVNEPWDIVIVDETHRLLGNQSLYHTVLGISQRVSNILLLSATPIQERNEEYRRLLSLLQPERYLEMTEDRFAWLVKKQKRIQKVVNQQLGRLDRYEEYKEIIVDNLKEIASTLSDQTFSKLVEQIDLENDEKHGINQVKDALSYVCENYRLERRVIRNRRLSITSKMASRTLVENSYVPMTNNETYNESGVIQTTLAYLSANGLENEAFVKTVAIPLLSALFSSPRAFADALDALSIKDEALKDASNEWLEQAENEHLMVNTALDEDPDLIKGRLLRVLDYIEQETDATTSDACKIVIFTSHTSTLHEFQKLLTARLEPLGLKAVSFSADMERADLDDSVYAFQNDPNCRIIICDETGGEGRNFQNAEQVIHIDLPWDANALEQRIGRLDRLGREPEREVRSVVFFTENTVEEQLFHIWRDGMKLFEQSLSGLEIITGELNKLIVCALLDDYYNGLLNSFDDILDEADEMRESVEDEQIFDIGATLYRPLTDGIDAVLSQYEAHDDSIFARAMLGWGEQAGLVAERPTSDGLIEFKESNFSIRAAKQSLFVPPDWGKYTDASIVSREGKLLGSFDRKTAAVREDILFFAPGDAVYDSIISNALGCSRGRCAAIQVHSNFNYDGFVFIYDVQPPVDTMIESGVNLEALSRYRMYLPLEQIVVTVPLTKDSAVYNDDQISQFLRSVNHHKADHIGKRYAQRGMLSPLERFIAQNPSHIWEQIVKKASSRAYSRAIQKMTERSDLKTAYQEMQRLVNGRRAECYYYERSTQEAEELARQLNLVYQSLIETKPVLDAACLLRVRNNG